VKARQRQQSLLRQLLGVQLALTGVMNQIQAKARFNISNMTRMTRLLPGKVSIDVKLQVWLYSKSKEKYLFQYHHITTYQLLTAENWNHTWGKKLR